MPGLLLFVPVALLGNALGAGLRYPDIGSAILFAPYAALTVALVVSARRHWVWYILVESAALLVTSWPRWSLSFIVLAEVANVARAVTAAVMLRRLFNGQPRLDSLWTLGGLVISAVLVAPAVGASIGAADVVLHDHAASYSHAWSAWFVSNALTGLSLLPALLLGVANHGRWRRPPMDPRRAAEALALAGALAAVAAYAFLLPTGSGARIPLPFYAPLPLLIWAALRFGSGGAAAALTVVTYAAIVGADRGTGPFFDSAPDRSVLLLQVYLLLTALPLLCIAAINTSRLRIVQLHHLILASMQDHVAILDGKGVVDEANDSWRRFIRRPDVAPFRRVDVGDNFAATARAAADRGDADAARVSAGLTSVLTGRERRCDIEFDQLHTGAHERYALTIEALARAGGGAIVRRSDVTARHQAQMEIEEQRRQLSHLARVSVLGQLSGALAHELNQPLAAIAGNAEAAHRLLERDTPDLVELDAIVTDIIAANHRAAQVIRRLRALLNRDNTFLQPLNAADLVDEVLELAHAELITRRVTTTIAVAPNLPQVLGDRVQLQQVLLNLVLNACEAMTSTAASERRLSVSVTTDSRRNVQLSVRDRGSGIDASMLDRLFEPFVTTKRDGLGLGLSISRTIVAVHGGRLWAENNVDRGATVHCVLTAVAQDRAPERAMERAMERPRERAPASSNGSARRSPVVQT